MEGMGMNPEFWRGKRVFMTGHTGFKGSWLSLWLQRLGSEVTGYALNPPTNPGLFEVANVGAGMKSIIADIRDPESLSRSMQDAKPDVVIHMAAQPLVRYSYQAPVETYATNVMGSVHLLEAVRKTETVRAVVNVTSDKCYENKEWPWGYRENEPMGGYDPYSNSKGCAELVTAAYRNSFFNPAKYAEHGVAIASGRAGNVIGGGDWATDRLIPDILRAIEAGQAVNIRSPHAIRPWQHVLEPLSGYLALAEQLFTEGPLYAEGWNFGPADEDAKPVQWIVEQLTAQWGEGAIWQLDQQPQPHEAHYLKLDCSKARARLNWYPRWSLSETLSSIVSWHKAWLEHEDMQAVTLDQISNYETTYRQIL
ncbi:CDP-glucose 4,6-dehydratase [Candidatus Magnetaquicoccaceae bacterium FCR-1]|uniref:CDP-glucose 4,6-dehydratase n=2 Tax=Candidatus Magnetaquiglobus chichijimensis TaxID=3141448 RepID=A0ABQ0CBT3_9PROT